MTATPHPSLRVPPKCPACGRLTVDNTQHCPKLKPGRWALLCAAITCRCGLTYRNGTRPPTVTPGRKP